MGNKAQPGRVPVVYFFKVADRDVFKIGFTVNDPLARLRALRAGCPDVLDMWAVVPTTQPVELEKQIHSLFASDRIRGEWFMLTASRLVAFFAQHNLTPVFRADLTREITESQATRILTATEQWRDNRIQMLKFKDVAVMIGVPYKQVVKILRRSIPTYEMSHWRAVKVSNLREWAESQRGNVNVTEETARRAVELLQ